MVFRLSCLLFVVNSYFICFSQKHVSVDSLNKVLEVGISYFNTDSDTFLLYNVYVDSILSNYPVEGKNLDEYYKIKSSVKNNLGVYYWREEQLSMALVELDSSTYYKSFIDDPEGMILGYNNIALVYSDMGDVYKAEKAFNKALIMLEGSDDLGMKISVNNNLGYLFYQQKMYKKVSLYFNTALDLKLIEDTLNAKMGAILGNLGLLNLKQGYYDKSSMYLNRALVIFQEINDRDGIAGVLDKYGQYYEKKGDLINSKLYFEEALDISTETGRVAGRIHSLNGLSRVYFANGDYETAKGFAERAYAIIEGVEKNSTKVLVYKSLYKIYKELSEDTKAFQFFELYHSINDSLINDEFVRGYMYQESALKYKMEKDSINQAYEKEKLGRDYDSKVERQIFIFTILVIIIVILFLVFAVRGYRLRQRLMQENYRKEQLLNKQLEFNLIEKSKLLTKESLKNIKSEKVIDEIDVLIKESAELNSDEINKNMSTIKSEIIENKLTRKKIDSHHKFLEKENEEFIFKLKKMYPKLTPGDLKLCVLLRSNYSSDEICMMLSVSKNTFSSSKYRIRRRMNLEKGQRLQDFLLGL